MQSNQWGGGIFCERSALGPKLMEIVEQVSKSVLHFGFLFGGFKELGTSLFYQDSNGKERFFGPIVQVTSTAQVQTLKQEKIAE